MIQKLRFFLSIIFIVFLFASCEKELSYENGGIPPVAEDTGSVSGTAVFSLNGGSGSCTGAVINGTYSKGTALTTSNTVRIQVTVDSIGTYDISTSSANGISFSGSGTFTTAGIQIITLTGSGTPTSVGSFSYTFGSAKCSFSIVVIDPSAIPAVFSLGGSPAACTGFSLGGSYTSGSPVTVVNTVSLQVNVTTLGTYSLSSGVINGISFSGSGVFTATGNQSVTLKASGTPTSSGLSNFVIIHAGDTCTFTVPVTAPSAFSLSGAPGNCTTAIVAGTYQNGTALTTGNTVTIEVNVTSIGGYTVSSNTVNGMTFTGSGTFTALGTQNIVLTGTGTPTAAGTFTFNPQVGTSGCTFDVVVAAAPIPAGTYSCKINGTLFNFTDRAVAENLDTGFGTPTPYLYLNGYTGPPNGETVPQLQIFINKNDGSAVGTGSYNVDGFLAVNGYRIEIDFHELQTDMSTIIWNTSSTLFPPANPAFIINVTQVSATRVKGTFSGKLQHTLDLSDPTIKTVTEGVFDLPIQ